MSSFKLPENKKIPEHEDDVLAFWKKNKIFEKSVDQRPKDNRYVFYDGPPFISGLPHYGHLLGSIAKDVIPRYWTMKGKRVERVWGWDAHGLTVENKVQKELGIKNRRDIEEYGLEKFTQACYEYTSRVPAEWDWYIDRIGRWVDIKNAYKTTDQDYMESVIWVFKELYDKGLIYEGIRTSLFCVTCGTPVSNFEVAMDNSYREEVDPSIIVKFKVTTKSEFLGAFMLAWTTTPWTIPSNRALVVDEKEKYVLVKSNGENYIVAKKRVESVFKDTESEVVKEFSGKKLLGVEYEPIYDFYQSKDTEFKVYSYVGMVTMEEGTGIVHSAPGFGEVDTEMGKENDLTLMLKLDDEGKFIAGDDKENPYAQMLYTKANGEILKDLKNRNLLFTSEKITHRVPYHDRCDTTLIYKAQNSWFIKVSGIKDDMYKNNEKINWVPQHLKEGRFKKGIEQAPDWGISRNRFWATPMPVWENEDGEKIVVSSIKELEELSGQKVKDLHRPYIDEVKIEKDGKIYTRREEVLDSWMEAGSMPYAQIHYPFENKDIFDATFPGDYVVEYVGQVRAWFYVMHVLSTALRDEHSFKNVVSTGVMAGNDGRKMSKTYENYTDPKEVLENIGGDAVRLYLMNSPLMIGENLNFDDAQLKSKLNNVLNPLWNSTKFFLMYAKNNNWDPKSMVMSKNELDIWILARLHETVKGFSENMEAYLVAFAVQPIEDFVDDLSRWYVRRSRDRITAGNNEATSTLYEVLVTISKATAPIIPFMAENIFQYLVVGFDSEAKESVHLSMYPKFDEKMISENTSLLKKMKNTREIVSLALSIRDEHKIKIRQPLGSLNVEIAGEDGEFVEDLVKDEVNVKIIEVGEQKGKFETAESANFKVYLDTDLTEELRIEGTARELTRTIQGLRKKEGLSVEDNIEATFVDKGLNKKAVEEFGDEIKTKVNAKTLEAGKEFLIKKL